MAVLYGSLGATTIYGRTEQGMTAQKETVQAIRMLPSADAVEVVRCERCMHYNSIDFQCYYHGSICFKPNDYCPYGRVRDDG